MSNSELSDIFNDINIVNELCNYYNKSIENKIYYTVEETKGMFIHDIITNESKHFIDEYTILDIIITNDYVVMHIEPNMLNIYELIQSPLKLKKYKSITLPTLTDEKDRHKISACNGNNIYYNSFDTKMYNIDHNIFYNDLNHVYNKYIYPEISKIMNGNYKIIEQSGNIIIVKKLGTNEEYKIISKNTVSFAIIS